MILPTTSAVVSRFGILLWIKLDYLAGNCVKYVCRAGHKNQETEIDDWLKIRAYVNRKIKALSTDENT